MAGDPEFIMFIFIGIMVTSMHMRAVIHSFTCLLSVCAKHL